MLLLSWSVSRTVWEVRYDPVKLDMPVTGDYSTHGIPQKDKPKPGNTYQNVSRVDRSCSLQSTLAFTLIVGCVFAFGFAGGLVVLGRHDNRISGNEYCILASDSTILSGEI